MVCFQKSIEVDTFYDRYLANQASIRPFFCCHGFFDTKQIQNKD